MEKTNNTTIINLQNEANIHAEGDHVHGNSISVVRINDGKVFVSIIDAAKSADTHAGYLASRLRNKDICTIKGQQYCYLSRLMESADTILTCLRDTGAEVERRKADEDDARKWREYQAELERIRKEEEDRIEAERKAKEKYEEDKQKAISRILRRKEIANRKASEFDAAAKRVTEAEEEYFNLTGEHYGDSITA